MREKGFLILFPTSSLTVHRFDRLMIQINALPRVLRHHYFFILASVMALNIADKHMTVYKTNIISLKIANDVNDITCLEWNVA